MTKEEIIKAGIRYRISHYPIMTPVESTDEEDLLEVNRNKDFEAGAQWAMEELTTNANVESKCGKLRANEVSSLHVFLTGAEAERENQEAVRKFMRQVLIDESCAWLEKYLRDWEFHTYGNLVGLHNNCVEDFRKAMEG